MLDEGVIAFKLQRVSLLAQFIQFEAAIAEALLELLEISSRLSKLVPVSLLLYPELEAVVFIIDFSKLALVFLPEVRN